MPKRRLTPEELVQLLSAIGEPTRIEIVNMLANQAMDVSSIAMNLGQSQPRVSRHLKILAVTGIVGGTRTGSRVTYDLCRDHPAMTIIGLVTPMGV